MRAWGPTLDVVFERAAEALTAVIAAPDSINPQDCVFVKCRAADPEVLFVDFLNRIVLEMSVRGMLFSRFRVKVEGENLTAEICGEPIDYERHRPAVEIKGATFTRLSVKQEDGGWVGQCVLDL